MHNTTYLEELPVGDVSVPVHVVDPEEELKLLLPVLITNGELSQAEDKLCKEGEIMSYEDKFNQSCLRSSYIFRRARMLR